MIMFTLPKKIKYLLISLLYGMMVSMPAVAEDIEIYKSSGATTTSTQPNIMFVLDTSGSMGTLVSTRADYDPLGTYNDADACYDEGQVYVIRSGFDFLSTNGSGETNAELICQFFSFGDSDFNYYTRRFNDSAMTCDAASSLNGTGFFTGVIAQYISSVWSDLASDEVNAPVECAADSGNHGQVAGDAKVYAINSGANGWSAVSTDEIVWSASGTSYTMYDGHYLNYIISEPAISSSSRLDIMKDVMTNLVSSITDVNIGLMRFSSNGEGGMVVTPIADIETGTQRADFEAALNAMTAGGVTPLSESFYEAVMYMKGGAVDYGNSSSPVNSVATSQSGGSYISPITNECQKNFVVLLTDGDPVSDSVSSARLNNIEPGLTCTGNCLDEIAKSVGSNDQNLTLDDNQVISTFTIGFANSNPLLQAAADESLAETGTGERFFADNATSLASSLNSIVVNVYETDTSFSSPAVSVNAFNRSTHLDDLYFTLFQPSIGPRWAGNLKKYKLEFKVDTADEDGDGDVTERLPFIADATSTPSNPVKAINKTTGFFAEGARSYWSDDVDGFNINEGGAANEFENNGSRNVYTFTGGYTETNGVFVPDEGDLTVGDNNVDKGNAAITEAPGMLDIVGATDKFGGTPRRTTLLDWASGLDVFDKYGATGTTDDQRLEMGDPLHSQPALVQYGGDEDNPDLVAYVATNDGYLHAIDADNGREIFSFIPQELLSNLNILMDNTSGDKTYGLDGDVVAWINDIPDPITGLRDGIINGSDTVYLYITMRRGGNNIYSLDVTDRNNPKLRWVIKGGVGDYAEMGQTWSTVNVEKIKNGPNVTDEKVVLIFGGGYDEDQDNVSVRTTDDVGRAVYIADADTGALMWSAGAGAGSYNTVVSEMDYSIPARVKPLDMSGDGFIDRLYVADMGGQIFRFDINNSNGLQLSASVTGGLIADLADSGMANARRFYYPPDVALVANEGKAPYLAMAITSGYRAHPNDLNIRDRIYVVKDNNIYNIPDYTSYTPVLESDLYNATLNLAGGDGVEAENLAAEAALDANDGWYIELDDGTGTNTWEGEKGLAEVLILEGVVIATTFTPINSTTVTNSCNPQSGTGKVYFVDLFDASAAFPSDNDSRSDRVKVLSKGGIPPSPNVIIPKDGEATLCVGTECEAADLSKGVRKTHWYEVEK
ncbi:MAG: hypothetical protein COA54_11140 [Thiotrichaceae bacterium]|nr:MAG: hypothetical protein COA54_11140 [Thiotrichaceae bacterium]